MKMREISRVWDKKLIDNNNLDFYNNETNEGEIHIPLVNLSPFDLFIKKGDKIAQALIKTYRITEDDAADGIRIGGFGSTNEIKD